MRDILPLMIIACTAALCSVLSAQNKTRPTWSDEFQGRGAPDRNKWTFEQGFLRNQELQWYQNNAWQENGELIIEARREQVRNTKHVAGSPHWYQNRQHAQYTSASLRTVEKYYFQYGRMQVRAKIPCVPGAWPAIWTLGKKGEWPNNGECDLMEYYKPDILLANLVKGTTKPHNAAWDTAKYPVSTQFATVDSDWRNQYHVWTMQWDEENIRLYVDNVLLNTTSQTWLQNAVTTWGPKHPFKQPHEILLNLAIGGNGGDPSKTTFPIRYHIDYVRVWEGYTANQAPTNMALPQNQVTEGQPAGTVVGKLYAADPDPAEVISYSLVNGEGATHNASFSVSFISGETRASVLKTKEVLKYDDGSTRSIRVRATDIEGATYEKVITIQVKKAAS
jgi:beta-glucanase (GH16 family)